MERLSVGFGAEGGRVRRHLGMMASGSRPCRCRSTPRSSSSSSSSSPGERFYPPPPSEKMTQVLFVECGFGADQHGQSATKACVRACRDAIEFNSIPSIAKIVPGGYENMKLVIKIGTPKPKEVDEEEVKKVFPYGKIASLVVQEGGLNCSSGVVIEEMGDETDEFLIAVAAVTVGY